MAKVTKIQGETTYDITGLTTKQAATVAALLGQSTADTLMISVYDALIGKLHTDPAYREREVVWADRYEPVRRAGTYYTREREDKFC